MNHWLRLCEEQLAEVGAGPLGPAPPSLCHYRVLLIPTFSPPLLIDTQFPTATATATAAVRLCIARGLPFGFVARERHYAHIDPGLLSVVSPLDALALRDQADDPVMRDGMVTLGCVCVGGQRSRFVARTRDEPGHRACFTMMAQIACVVLGERAAVMLRGYDLGGMRSI
jgi:hypothetical protein